MLRLWKSRVTVPPRILPPIAFLLLALVPLAAQQAASAIAETQIDNIVALERKKQQMPAVTIAVAKDDRVVYSKAFGLADLENNVPATPETLIRTGSIAKPISAAAALTLVDAGKLDLDAPIQKYCPEFPEKPWPITTRELLTHTSGIRHYKEGEMESTKHFSSMSQGFSVFAADPLLFEPATKFQYSTFGYSVLGCVIEGASGEKFYDYLHAHVLTPAGMTHTFVDDAYDIIPHRARGYDKVSGQVKNAELMDSSYKIPGGGLLTTADDLVRFATAMIDGKILRPETLAMMWSPTKLRDGTMSSYGMGFGTTMVDGQKYLGHTGSQPGTNTIMAILPGKRFAVAVLANIHGVKPSDISEQILDLYHMPRPHPGEGKSK
jgi:serine beta-lactamase-like protein LACTB, mitochondrial